MCSAVASILGVFGPDTTPLLLSTYVIALSQPHMQPPLCNMSLCCFESVKSSGKPTIPT